MLGPFATASRRMPMSTTTTTTTTARDRGNRYGPMNGPKKHCCAVECNLAKQTMNMIWHSREKIKFTRHH